MGSDEGNLSSVEGRILVEQPNNRIYNTSATFEFIKSSCETIMMNSLNNDNIVLRGMKLKNTPAVYGIVIYTGSETKIQMNNTASTYKTSKLMDTTNRYILLIFVL